MTGGGNKQMWTVGSPVRKPLFPIKHKEGNNTMEILRQKRGHCVLLHAIRKSSELVVEAG